MHTILIFKIKDPQGFEKDSLIKKVNKKLKNNYKFKHIIKGDYIFTPDLAKLIKELIKDPTKVKDEKEYALLLYILSLYKYAIMKGYLELYQIHNQVTDIAYNETFNSLIKYIQSMESLRKVSITLGYVYTVNGYTSVVLDCYTPIKRNLLYKKYLLIINLTRLINRKFNEAKHPVIYLLETPLSKYRRFFTTEELPEFYTIKNNKLVKLFECAEDEVLHLGFVLQEPPVLPILEHYIKTGEIIKVNGYTPIEQLIRNFYAVVADTETHNPNDYYLTSNHTPKMSTYHTDIVSKGNTLTLSEEKIKKYYTLFKNIVTLNKDMADKLYYNYKMTSLKQYFNPPIKVIKQLLEQSIASIIQNIDFSKMMDSKIEIIWRNLKTKRGEEPILIILRAYFKVQNQYGKYIDYNMYYTVYNNLAYNDRLITKYFRMFDILTLKKRIMDYFYDTQTGNNIQGTALVRLTVV